MKLQSKCGSKLVVALALVGAQGWALAAGQVVLASPFAAPTGPTVTAKSSEPNETEAQEVSEPLKGCYRIIGGEQVESSVDAKHVVGSYRFVLQSDLAGKGKKRFVLSGPLSGAEDGGEEGGGEGPHGGHSFGTDKAVGTFSSDGDSIQVTSVSCPSGDGTPRRIVGVETMKFKRGTSLFTNIQGGQVQFNLVYDACNNKNNPVAKLTVISGQMCFGN